MSTLDEQVPKEVAVSADSILAATAKLGTRAADPPPASFRMSLISLLSAAIGLVGGIVAFALSKLIGVLITFSSSIASRLTSPARNITIWVGCHRHSGYRRPSGAFALVAMGVFGAASRARFIIFAFEITRDYTSVLPLMLLSLIAEGIAMLLIPQSSIMTETLARRGLHVHQDYDADVLAQARVAEIMDQEFPTLTIGTKVGGLAERIAQHDPAVARHEAPLILSDTGQLSGIITRGDLLRALDQDPSGRLPVVDRADHGRALGYLSRSGVMAARLRGFNDEHLREPGWFPRTRPVRSEKWDRRPARIPRSRAGKRKSALHSPKGKVPGIRICIANRRRL